MPPGLTVFQLKLIAAGLMLLDHVQYYLPGYPLWFRYLGRLSAPIFFFASVEGFIHTRSVPRLVARLFAGALIMAAGSRTLSHLLPWYKDSPNIFLSLGTCLLMLWALRWGMETNRPMEGNVLAALWAGLALLTEASVYGVGMALTFYYLRENRKAMSLAYVALSLLPSLSSFFQPQAWFLWDYQWMMVFALPLFLLYNEQRGSASPAAKWFFYVFYPVHLWLLYAVGRSIWFAR